MDGTPHERWKHAISKPLTEYDPSYSPTRSFLSYIAEEAARKGLILHRTVSRNRDTGHESEIVELLAEGQKPGEGQVVSFSECVEMFGTVSITPIRE